MSQILQNAIVCRHCNQKIVSEHVHDFKYCACKKVAVDGGQEYLKRTGNKTDYEEASVFTYVSLKADTYHELWIIFSPGGKNNPSTFFSRRLDAKATAKQMGLQFGGQWYISQLERV